MITWAQKKDIDNRYKQITEKIKQIGKQNGSFKVWEYPFIYTWLEKISKNFNSHDKMTILDFGCGIAPFAQFLSTKKFCVWAIDNNSWNYKNEFEKKLKSDFSGVNYWFGDIKNFDLTRFDFIFSCSVFEHIIGNDKRIQVMNALKNMLTENGKMMHIIDFYYPEYKEAAPESRTNFYRLAKACQFEIENTQLCPGSHDFNLNFVKQKFDLFERTDEKPQTRIAIGDDI